MIDWISCSLKTLHVQVVEILTFSKMQMMLRRVVQISLQVSRTCPSQIKTKVKNTQMTKMMKLLSFSLILKHCPILLRFKPKMKIKVNKVKKQMLIEVNSESFHIMSNQHRESLKSQIKP